MAQYSRVMRTIDSQLPSNVIDLTQSGVWDDDILYLVGKDVADITKVQLWDNRFTWKSIEYISTRKWDNLLLMDVDMNNLRNKGAKYLSRMQAPLLKELNLSSNGIGKEGFIHISKGNWPNLETIYFNGNSLGVDSMKHLNKNRLDQIIKPTKGNLGMLLRRIRPQTSAAGETDLFLSLFFCG